MSKVPEILDLLQEECGELVTQVSKVRRFGLEENKEKLLQECGDVSLLIDLLVAHEVFTYSEIDEAMRKKANKLAQWSTVYD